jgi:hypothetical protein
VQSSDEAANRNARRVKWAEDRRITAERIHHPHNDFHYFDDIPSATLPVFTASYQCSGCDKNHYEEDCPYYFGGIKPASVVRGTQRLQQINEDIENKRYNIRCRNQVLASDNEKLANGWKFCVCCARMISPDKLQEVARCHSGSIEYAGSTGEETWWSCCHSEDEISFDRMAVTHGCCTHTHTFES